MSDHCGGFWGAIMRFDMEIKFEYLSNFKEILLKSLKFFKFSQI